MRPLKPQAYSRKPIAAPSLALFEVALSLNSPRFSHMSRVVSQASAPFSSAFMLLAPKKRNFKAGASGS